MTVAPATIHVSFPVTSLAPDLIEPVVQAGVVEHSSFTLIICLKKAIADSRNVKMKNANTKKISDSDLIHLKAYQVLTTSGWGLYGNANKVLNVLQSVTLNFYSNDLCFFKFLIQLKI